MRIFRTRTIRLAFVFVTGLTFLNMSFVIAEIAALRSAYNKSILENVARMISTSMAEEETDMSGGAEHNHSLKEIDLLDDNLYHLQFEGKGIANTLKAIRCEIDTHPGYCQRYAPPPDLHIG